MNIEQLLLNQADEAYASFQSKLIPTIDPDSIMGVRIPIARSIAKELYKKKEYEEFIHTLPHSYYDENILHGLILSEIKDYDACIMELERFLPYIDNWAVCDVISPKCFKAQKEKLIVKIMEWVQSNHTYTCRFGLKILMTHYLDDQFIPDYLETVASIHHEDYYMKMMVAWFFATALAKQWESTIPYIEHNRLELWTHNKAIQKSLESYRITKEQKIYLKNLKRPVK